MNRGNDICLQLTRLCGDLSGMQAEINTASENAAEAAAKTIQAEQRRVFAKANFERDKKKSRTYKNAGGDLIAIYKSDPKRGMCKFEIGYDTRTLRVYPELLVIEFGRPGKSPGRSKNTDKLGRKKGKFPEEAVVMPIRMGFQIAKDEAYGKYDEQLTRAVKSAWNNSSR